LCGGWSLIAVTPWGRRDWPGAFHWENTGINGGCHGMMGVSSLLSACPEETMTLSMLLLMEMFCKQPLSGKIDESGAIRSFEGYRFLGHHVERTNLMVQWTWSAEDNTLSTIIQLLENPFFTAFRQKTWYILIVI
jgi:hypothetical protein